MKQGKHPPREVIVHARGWIARIFQWTAGQTAESFAQNELLQAGVERAFAALGEALKNLPDSILASEPEIPWRKARGLREIISHDYWDGVEEETIWNTVQYNLPPLDAALARLDKKLQEQSHDF